MEVILITGMFFVVVSGEVVVSFVANVTSPQFQGEPWSDVYQATVGRKYKKKDREMFLDFNQVSE